MTSYDAGHRESQTFVPDPLEGTGFWNIGAWALPATMLSICSAAVFATVFVFLEMGGPKKGLFVLPFPQTAIIGGVAAVLAWVVVFVCRRRPGRLWPRLWALALACANSVITGIGLLFPDRPWSLALTLAGLSAAIALAPRLAKVRPDSAMVQRIAPLSLLISLIVVPSSCTVRQVIAKQAARNVDQRIQQFRAWTLEVKEATSFNWTRMENSPEGATKAIETLRKLRFQGAADDAELWKAAMILGKDADLTLAMEGLTEAVTDGFDPERVPRVSHLREAVVRWDPYEHRWESYQRFPQLSGIVGAYHQELGRLFGELESRDESGNIPRLVDYRQHYLGQKERLQTHLNEIGNSFTDHWAVTKVGGSGREKPLREVLGAPLVNSDQGNLAAGQLVTLMSLPLDRVSVLDSGGANTGETFPTAPGCHGQNYMENERHYFRLDCYSYAPRKDSTGAELRIEMRLVYKSDLRRQLGQRSLPFQLYFHFVIPEAVKPEDVREEVMTALASATRQFSPEAPIWPHDRGSVIGGFTIRNSQRRLTVTRPEIVTFEGITPEVNAWKVQVFGAGG